MPDLIPAERAIVDLVGRVGPATKYDLGYHLADEDIPIQALEIAEASLLSCDLLLERERTVECPEVGCVRGRRRLNLGILAPDGWVADVDTCLTCEGTGSVKEWVIGVACGKCKGRGETFEFAVVGTGAAWCPCPRCSSTPTPGLEPGSQSAPQLAPREER